MDEKAAKEIGEGIAWLGFWLASLGVTVLQEQPGVLDEWAAHENLNPSLPRTI